MRDIFASSVQRHIQCQPPSVRHQVILVYAVPVNSLGSINPFIFNCYLRYSFHIQLQHLLFTFYRAMHFSANARSWDRMSSVCPSVCPSVTLVISDHIGWKSWKLIAQTISPTLSLFAAKRRSTYSQGNMGKFWGD